MAGLLNLRKNEDFIRRTISGTDRKPDFWESGMRIIEVKNSLYVSFNSQLRDMADWAKRENHTFELWVRHGATLSAPVQDAIT